MVGGYRSLVKIMTWEVVKFWYELYYYSELNKLGLGMRVSVCGGVGKGASEDCPRRYLF
jgi:hypothetical protein